VPNSGSNKLPPRKRFRPTQSRALHLQVQRPTMASPAAFLVKDGKGCTRPLPPACQRSTQLGEDSHSLSEGLGDLADERGPTHIHGRIDLAGLRSRIVLEDFHHQGCIVRDNNARL
jgi:hypothetical protein